MDSFWQNNGDTIIVGVVTAIVILILSEPIKALFKKLGKWLETISQSAGFGFKKRYCLALQQNHQWLKLIGIYDAAQLHPPRLQSVYISLRMAAADADDSPRFPWDQIFSGAKKHMVILGQPGAGKTTLLDYLILVFTGHAPHPLRKRLNEPMPMFARLRDLGAPDGPQTVLEALESPASTGLKRVPKGFFERHLKQGHGVVLLDGLDEVLDKTRHKKAVAEIKQFIAEYPENWIVVTCRVAGWRNQLPGFQTYEVQEFDNDDIRHFISAWYREVLRTQAVNRLGPSPKPEAMQEAERAALEKAVEQADALWESLRQNEGLLRIACTPLILSLITLVHKTRTDLPQGRSRLYKECLEILLEKWDQVDKNLPVTEKTPTLNDKLLALRKIAVHFLMEGLLEMDAGGLEALVEPLRSSLKTQIEAGELIRQIYERSGVLVEQAIGRYGFAHRALHDYLTASDLVDEEKDDLLLKHAAEERWREVILIAIGLAKPARRVKNLLDVLLKKSGENPASLALAGWSLAEDIQVGADLRAEVRRRLLDGLNSAETGLAFGQLSSALMAADPTAARAWMKSTLTGRDPALRTRVLTLLPGLGEAAAPLLPMLVDFMTDKEAEAALRAQAALTIGRLGLRGDRSLKPALRKTRQEKDEALKAAATWAWCELGWFEDLGLVKVPASEFLMGSSDADPNASPDENPQHTLYLPTFYIGKCPVTVAEYSTFVQGSKYETANERSLQGKDNHPVVYVTWHDAMAYARWHGMTLPSEAEWENAARGTDGRIYPWGNAWQPNCVNTAEYWAKGSRGLLSRLLRRSKFTGSTTPVGYFSPQGDSPYGCVDMSGNVWEWTRSIFKEYPYNPADGREDLTDKNASRVLRGGACRDGVRYARCASRYGDFPHDGWDLDGFRVVVAGASPAAGS